MAIMFVALLFVLSATFLILADTTTTIPDPGENTQDFIRWVFDAIHNGNGKYIAAAVISLIVFLARTYATKKSVSWLKWLQDGKWAWSLVVVLGALTALSSALISGEALGGVKGILTILAAGAFTGLGATGSIKGAKEWFGKKGASTPTDATTPTPK